MPPSVRVRLDARPCRSRTLFGLPRPTGFDHVRRRSFDQLFDQRLAKRTGERPQARQRKAASNCGTAPRGSSAASPAPDRLWAHMSYATQCPMQSRCPWLLRTAGHAVVYRSADATGRPLEIYGTPLPQRSPSSCSTPLSLAGHPRPWDREPYVPTPRRRSRPLINARAPNIAILLFTRSQA